MPTRTARPVDAVLPANPQTVVWGQIPADRAPVLRVRDGSTVRIETVSHGGLTREEPVTYFESAGIPAAEVLPEAVAIYREVKRAGGMGVHILTGPVHIEGAEPGDVLEIRVLDVAVRVPYGVNTTGPGYGVLGDLLTEPVSKTVRLDLHGRQALFSGTVRLPLAPFMGIMAVAPRAEIAPVSTKPAGEWGGNLDFRHLVAGSALFLPVFHEGALFYTGDGHAAQGDGEVDGTAIETSLAPTLRFIVHKGGGDALRWPRAEDEGHHYVMGMDESLDVALRNAVRETVSFLQRKACLSAADAYVLASLAVDFRIGEAVNRVKMVYGAIPRSVLGA
jgi:acetamidase/formamidase